MEQSQKTCTPQINTEAAILELITEDVLVLNRIGTSQNDEKFANKVRLPKKVHAWNRSLSKWGYRTEQATTLLQLHGAIPNQTNVYDTKGFTTQTIPNLVKKANLIYTHWLNKQNLFFQNNSNKIFIYVEILLYMAVQKILK